MIEQEVGEEQEVVTKEEHQETTENQSLKIEDQDPDQEIKGAGLVIGKSVAVIENVRAGVEKGGVLDHAGEHQHLLLQDLHFLKEADHRPLRQVTGNQYLLLKNLVLRREMQGLFLSCNCPRG